MQAPTEKRSNCTAATAGPAVEPQPLFDPTNPTVMQDTSHQKSNAQFQLERLVFFTDAVFAIAITLLVIELKIPEVDRGHLTEKLLWHSFVESLPKFVSFAISFYVIGTYWLSHQRMFLYVVKPNQRLFRTNLLFLFPVVLMPFSTAYVSGYYSDALRLPLLVYTANICLAGLLLRNLWQLIADPAQRLSRDIGKAVRHYNNARSLAVPVVFALILVASYVSVKMAYRLLPFAALTGGFVKFYFSRKYGAAFRARTA